MVFELAKKESGHVNEKWELTELLLGNNVVVDDSLMGWNPYQIYFALLREEYSALRIATSNVMVSRGAVFQRAVDRAFLTGRTWFHRRLWKRR